VFKGKVSVRAIETVRWVTASKKKKKANKMLEKAKYKVADIFFVVYHSLKSFVFARLFFIISSAPSCLHCIMHNKKQFRAASCDAEQNFCDR
jgi:hypothetical protein